MWVNDDPPGAREGLMNLKTSGRQVTKECKYCTKKHFWAQTGKAEEMGPWAEALISLVLRALPRFPRELLHSSASSNCIHHILLCALWWQTCISYHITWTQHFKITRGDRRKGLPLQFYLLLVIGHQGKLPRPFWSGWHRCCCHWKRTADLSHQQCWSQALR